MHSVLQYTVQPGDTLALITISIRASAGVSAADVVAANPSINFSRLAVKTRLKIPYRSAGGYFEYETHAGDDIASICNGLADAAGLTVLDVINHNYALSQHQSQLDLSKLEVGQILLIPYAPAFNIKVLTP